MSQMQKFCYNGAERVETDATVVSNGVPSEQDFYHSDEGHAHPSHIRHFIFLTNMLSTIWTCATCNKTSKDIKDTSCFRCEKCNFFLCRACFEPKKYLLHEHVLTKTDVRVVYHASRGLWKCDCCGGNNGPENTYPRHCKECNFDLCEKCCEPRRTTLHLHDLYKVNTELVYTRFMGGWKCDSCSTRFAPQVNKFPFHCNICEFDLCDACMEISDSKAISRYRSAVPITRVTASGNPVAQPEEELVDQSAEGKKVDDICIICMTNEKNATIIHGETGHVCCCIHCAKELQRRGNGCPICRKPVQQVVRQFLV